MKSLLKLSIICLQSLQAVGFEHQSAAGLATKIFLLGSEQHSAVLTFSLKGRAVSSLSQGNYKFFFDFRPTKINLDWYFFNNLDQDREVLFYRAFVVFNNYFLTSLIKPTEARDRGFMRRSQEDCSTLAYGSEEIEYFVDELERSFTEDGLRNFRSFIRSLFFECLQIWYSDNWLHPSLFPLELAHTLSGKTQGPDLFLLNVLQCHAKSYLYDHWNCFWSCKICKNVCFHQWSKQVQQALPHLEDLEIFQRHTEPGERAWSLCDDDDLDCSCCSIM